MDTATPPRLSPDQVERYNREGYLVVPDPVLPTNKFSALKAHFDRKLEAWPADKRPEAMDTPHFEDTKLFEWAFSPEILDLVEPIIGPDIVLFSTHFICKPQGDGRRVPWHEDSAYWRGRLDPMEVVTVWLAIDPSTQENACMRVIPHTHNTGRKGFSDYDQVDTSKNVFPIEIKPSQRKDALAVPIELEANHCSLHDARLMHGSPANTSNLRRCGWTLRFIPAYVKSIDHELHPIYLARGRNLAEQPLADPTHSHVELMQKRKDLRISTH